MTSGEGRELPQREEKELKKPRSLAVFSGGVIVDAFLRRLVSQTSLFERQQEPILRTANPPLNSALQAKSTLSPENSWARAENQHTLTAEAFQSAHRRQAFGGCRLSSTTYFAIQDAKIGESLQRQDTLAGNCDYALCRDTDKHVESGVMNGCPNRR